jgi:hypothetical protein
MAEGNLYDRDLLVIETGHGDGRLSDGAHGLGSGSDIGIVASRVTGMITPTWDEARNVTINEVENYGFKGEHVHGRAVTRRRKKGWRI